MNKINAITKASIIAQNKTGCMEAVNGGNQLKVQSAIGYKKDGFVIIGNIGMAGTVLLQIASVADNIITTVETLPVIDRPRDVNVYYSPYNVRLLYSSDNKSGPFTAQHNSPISVNENPVVVMESSKRYVKVTYYSLTLQVETPLDEADVIDVLVPSFCSIEDVKNSAGLGTKSRMELYLVEEIRQRAQGEVESFLATRYQLPLSFGVPKIITHITSEIGGCFLLQQEGLGSQSVDSRLSSARKTLREISEGKIALTQDSGEVENGREGGVEVGEPDCPSSFSMGMRF